MPPRCENKRFYATPVSAAEDPQLGKFLVAQRASEYVPRAIIQNLRHYVGDWFTFCFCGAAIFQRISFSRPTGTGIKLAEAVDLNTDHYLCEAI